MGYVLERPFADKRLIGPIFKQNATEDMERTASIENGPIWTWVEVTTYNGSREDSPKVASDHVQFVDTELKRIFTSEEVKERLDFAGELKEFEGDKENSFYDIELDRLKRFYVDDDFYVVDSGVFNINNKIFNVSYEFNGEVHNLTGADTDYNDLIQYKDAHSEFDPKTGFKGNVVDAYNFGYKTSIEIKGIEFHFKVIVTKGKKTYATVFLSSNEEVDGKLHLYIDGVEKIYHAPLRGKEGKLIQHSI